MPLRVLLIVVGVALVAAACSRDEPSLAPEPGPLAFPIDDPATKSVNPAGGTLVMAVTGEIALVPWAIDEASLAARAVADLLFDGLTGIDPESRRAVPALAASWSVDDDGLEWTFALDPAATTVDGARVVAADVVRSLSAAMRRGPELLAGAPLVSVVGSEALAAGTVEVPDGLVAVDDSTVVIRLSAPLADLPLILASPTFGVAATSDRSDTVGTGPFELATAREDGVLELSARAGRLDEIVVVPHVDAESAYRAVVDGSADWAVVPPDVDDPDPQMVVDVAGTSTVFYGMNLAHPALADVAVRRAILLAIDPQAAHEALGLAGTPAPGVVPGSGPTCAARCDDPPAAAAIVAASSPPTLTLDYFSGGLGEDALAASVAADLRAAGFEVDVRARTFDEYATFLTGGDVQLFRYGALRVSDSPDPFLVPAFTSTGPDNVFAVSDEELDRLAATARETGEPDDYEAVADRALDLAVVVPISHLSTRVVIGPRVEGYASRPDGTFSASGLSVTAP